jgi:hypothetical protein
MEVTMRRLPLLAAPALGLLFAGPADAQIARHPTGVNVNAMAATTVFLTFGNLQGKVAVEAEWCGTLVPATPDVGDRCDPATVYGRMPLRYDLARASGIDGMTDIMTIPPSVARRAYQHAAAGGDATFYYVRRFVDPGGTRPDEYVTVTCRMTEGGARTPFSLVDVRLAFAGDDPVLSVPAGGTPPPIVATIRYNGTGRLRGRWEIVRPGEEPPSLPDLLTEAALPLERRATQRRYTELARFDLFLPPTGEATLEGPDPRLLPTSTEGAYLVLLRIEASDDKEGDSSLASAGVGAGIAHSGGVAGFPLPPLRYHVGSGSAVGVAAGGLRLLFPVEGATLADTAAIRFGWTRSPGAVFYRLEIESDEGEPLFQAILGSDAVGYEAPSWIGERVPGGSFRWRVVGLGAGGGRVAATSWQSARIGGREPPGPR